MKMLVYSRLLFPASKKSSYDSREHFFENTEYSLDDVYRCLSFLDKHRENLQIWMNDRIKKNYGRDTSLIYYDVTNYYFETDEQNDFLHKEVCKEHRPNPIIQMGLFIDNKGIPITYELFPGNTNDCLTYRPNLGRIKKQFDLGRVITVADKGMTTGDNIWYTINTPAHDGYVFSMSIRGAERSIKNYALKDEGYEWLGTEYKRKSRKCPRTIQVTSVTGKKIKKQVDEKQVVFWSEKYAKRAKAEREAALMKARDLAENPGNYTRTTSYGAAKYVKKIDYVTLEIGEVSGVIHDQLVDCWNWARKKEAVTEHAKIYIETLEAITYCEDCKGQYRTIDYGKKCPYCHSEHTYLLKGNEFNIKEIGIYEDSGA